MNAWPMWFAELWRRQARNGLRGFLETMPVRFVTMLICATLAAGGVFAGSYFGFRQLFRHIPPDSLVTESLFCVLFFVLGGMLAFSNGLIIYASLFQGPETRFLLASPLKADQVFAGKFVTAMTFSCAAFVVLGVPVLLAYGLTAEASVWFYPAVPIVFVMYAVLPCALGSIVALTLVNIIPRKRGQAFVLLLIAVITAAVVWVIRFVALTSSNNGKRDEIGQIFGMFAWATAADSPSRWVADVLCGLARKRMSETVRPLLLLLANASFAYLLAAILAKIGYRRGWDRLQGGSLGRSRYTRHEPDAWLYFLLRPFHPQTRLLIVKDFRTFRREPGQVLQLGIFTGLVLLCVMNARQFLTSGVTGPYQHMLGIIHFTAVSLLVSAYLARFIFPLLSLEGRKFWILGLLPISRDRLLMGKFLFAAIMACLISCPLTLVSDFLLRMPTEAILTHLIAMIGSAVALSAVCVGMSAWMPNFREVDPSKIVVGFGGTMFTLAAMGMVIVCVSLTVLPYHLPMVAESVSQDIPYAWELRIGGGLLWLMFIGFVGVSCLRVGKRRFREMEF